MNTNNDAERIKNLVRSRAPVPAHVEQEDTRLKLGEVPIPDFLETRHALIAGTTGAGKSQALYTGILSPIRARNQPAIIVDHSAEFLQRYYRPGIDKIFNPFDKRSVGWSPFNEIRRIYDFDRIAQAIIPTMAGKTANQDWQEGAQQLLANAMRGLWNLGREFRCNSALVYYLTKAPLHGRLTDPASQVRYALAKNVELRKKVGVENLEHLNNAQLAELWEAIFVRLNVEVPLIDVESLEFILHGSSSASLYDEGNEKALAITRNIISRYMQPFSYLAEGTFSMTDYVKQFEQPGHCKSWLFLSYTDASYAAIKSLFSIMVSCAVQSALELSESAARRFYLGLDEFASLDRIDAVDDALTKLRKRGGVVIAGIQSTAQLVEKYGEVGAQILLSCFGNVLMLRVADDQTAEKCSALIGDVEVFEKSTTKGSTENGDGSTSLSQSETLAKQVRRAVLPSEFFVLPDLIGYVRIGGESQFHKTSVRITGLLKEEPAEISASGVMLDLN
ncbi:type IV secretion system DNA-binding domain-containing protein [Herbaspirillum huttiense]|uniref:type IV secretion system DNA-binding domain-containing protein n=1 Tax=Herbaspirillum huttiense TaxID=863372 RepID=UPI003816B947